MSFGKMKALIDIVEKNNSKGQRGVFDRNRQYPFLLGHIGKAGTATRNGQTEPHFRRPPTFPFSLPARYHSDNRNVSRL